MSMLLDPTNAEMVELLGELIAMEADSTLLLTDARTQAAQDNAGQGESDMMDVFAASDTPQSSGEISPSGKVLDRLKPMPRGCIPLQVDARDAEQMEVEAFSPMRTPRHCPGTLTSNHGKVREQYLATPTPGYSETFLQSPGLQSHSKLLEKRRCPDCNRDIGGQLWHFEKHISSGSCYGNMAKRSASKENSVRIQSPLANIHSSSPLNTPPHGARTWQYPIPMTHQGVQNRVGVFGEGSLSGEVFTNPVGTGSSSVHNIQDAIRFDMDGVRGSGCPGVKVDWRAGNIFTTFPWQMFQQKDTPFWLSHVAGHGDDWVIRIRSNRCNPRVNTNGTVCEDCTSTRQQRTFRNAEDRAKESTTPPHMNALYLTHDQLAAKLAKKGISIRDLQQTVSQKIMF